MGAKLVRWLVFGVAIALIPLAYNYLSLQLRGSSPSMVKLVEHGELLLIVAAVCAASVGELVGSGSRMLSLKLLSGGGSLIILMLSALYFADVSVLAAEITAQQNSGKIFEADLVFNNSSLLFLFGVVSSGSCILLSEV